MSKREFILLILCVSINFLNAQIFSPPEIIIEDTGGSTFSYTFLAGDLNNDDRVDFVGRGQGNDFKFFFNNGDNSFDENSFNVGNSFTPISIADFNQDGLPDVLGHSIMIAINEGNNTFGYKFESSSSPNLDQRRVGVADFDGDGFLDYLSNPPVSFEDVLYWHKGDGDFNFSPQVAEISKEHSYTSIVDFNFDGAPDIVSANQFSHGQFKLMLNDGSGNFELWKDITEISISETNRFAGMADLDIDGDMELIGISQGSGVYYVENEGDEDFNSFPNFIDFGYEGGLPLAVLVEDANDDGYPDIIIYNDNGNDFKIYVYANNKNGGFTNNGPLLQLESYSGLPAFNSQTSRNLIQLIDMDNDNFPELIINDTKNGQVYMANNLLGLISVSEEKIPEFEIYPNPVAEFLNFEKGLSYDKYQILNINGAVVKKGIETNRIEISTLSSGQYFVVLSNNGKNVARAKFVKQ